MMCGGSVLICEREFEKDSVAAMYDRKRAVFVILIAVNWVSYVIVIN
jgi:hypothetical protein